MGSFLWICFSLVKKGHIPRDIVETYLFPVKEEEKVEEDLIQKEFNQNLEKEFSKLSSYIDKTAVYLIKISKDQIEIQSDVRRNQKQMFEVIQSVDSSVREANLSSNHAKQAADESQKHMTDLNSSISSISEIESILLSFSDDIKQLIKKMSSIEEIVFQSRILTFNANIEAARAGDAGKSFAVVADEMGKLAGIIGKVSIDIQEQLKGSNKKLAEMLKHVHEKVGSSVELIQSSQESYKEVVDNIYELSERIGSITKTISEYNQTSSEVENVLNKITQASASLGTAAANSQLLSFNLDEINNTVQAGPSYEDIESNDIEQTNSDLDTESETPSQAA
ncbi:MAG: hypothetical protein H6622_10310 [Halobacteriovoraceae bacterium]|nr:hypothetical protein [Halobacteriovoraceae bacterium]